jgi:hypothetical protein
MTEQTKGEWEPMRLIEVGSVADVVKSGGGKLSIPGGDPGESRKQTPDAP